MTNSTTSIPLWSALIEQRVDYESNRTCGDHAPCPDCGYSSEMEECIDPPDYNRQGLIDLHLSGLFVWLDIMQNNSRLVDTQQKEHASHEKCSVCTIDTLHKQYTAWRAVNSENEYIPDDYPESMEVVIQCVYSDKLATVSDILAVLAYIGHTVSKTGEVEDFHLKTDVICPNDSRAPLYHKEHWKIDGSKKEGGIKCKLR